MNSLTNSAGAGTYTTKRLAWPFLIIPSLLVLIYTMLS